MIRGTTQPFRIKLPCAVGELLWVTMKWWQDGNNGTKTAPLPITKRLSHCSVSNIYKCKLTSNVIANQQYYFSIENIIYAFIAPQNIDAGNTLVYDAKMKTLTMNDLTIEYSMVEDITNIIQLTFTNEINDSKELYVTLTAEETARFSDKHKAKMQMRMQYASNGKVVGSHEKLITVEPMNEDIFNDDIIETTDDSGWIVLDGKTISDE